MPNTINNSQLTDLDRLYPHSVRGFALGGLKLTNLVSRDKIVMWITFMSAGVSNGILANIRNSEHTTPSIFIWVCFLSSVIFLSLFFIEIASSFGREANLKKKIKHQCSWPRYLEQTLNDMENRYWSACFKGTQFNRTRWAFSRLPIIGSMIKADLRTQCLHILSGGVSDRMKIRDTIRLSSSDTGQVGYRNLFNNSTRLERRSLFENILSNADQSGFTKKQKNITRVIVLSLAQDFEVKGKKKSKHIKDKLDQIAPNNGMTIETIHKYILANTHSSLDLILHKSC